MASAPDDDVDDIELDEFEASASSNDSGESSNIKLEAGEHAKGRITDYDLGTENGAGYIELDGRRLYLNWTLRAQLLEHFLRGEPLAVFKLEETESFENDDGETVEYNPRELRFLKGGD